MELGNNLKNCNVLQYADDTSISLNGNSSDDFKELANYNINNCVEHLKIFI